VTRSIPFASKPIEERPAVGPCRRPEAPLDLRDLQARAGERAARDDRADGVEPAVAPGLRRGDDGDRDGAARGELHLLLVGDARHQLDGLGERGRDKQQGERQSCKREHCRESAERANHDPR
jgi:hypothetical protein